MEVFDKYGKRWPASMVKEMTQVVVLKKSNMTDRGVREIQKISIFDPIDRLPIEVHKVDK